MNTTLTERCGKSGISRIVLQWMERRIAKLNYKTCHRIALRICIMGFENGAAQRHLDAAKDSLYSAALIFDKESKI